MMCFDEIIHVLKGTNAEKHAVVNPFRNTVNSIRKMSTPPVPQATPSSVKVMSRPNGSNPVLKVTTEWEQPCFKAKAVNQTRKGQTMHKRQAQLQTGHEGGLHVSLA